MHIIFTDLKCRSGGRGGLLEVLMVFFQTCSRTHSDRLPVGDSPQCWGKVSCSWCCLSDLSTLKPCHWKRTGSLAFQNNSSLPLWSPLRVFGLFIASSLAWQSCPSFAVNHGCTTLYVYSRGVTVRYTCNERIQYFLFFFQEIQIINGVLTVFDVAWQIAV